MLREGKAISLTDEARLAGAEANEQKLEKLKHLNSGFVQVYRKGWKQLDALVAEGSSAVRLWIKLAENIDGSFGAVAASQKTLATLLGVSERTIRRWTRELEDRQYLVVIKLGPSTCAYALDPTAVWRSMDSRKGYSAFSARAIVAPGDAKVLSARLKTLLPRGEDGRAGQATVKGG